MSSSPSSSGGGVRKRSRPQMDVAATAPTATSDEQGSYGRSSRRVAVEGDDGTFIGWVYRNPPPPARFPGTTPMPRHLALPFYGEDEYHHDGEQINNRYSHKRARVPASSKAVLGLQELSAGDTERAECAVCLQDFCAGDKLRAMPCSHAFHQHCIFGWLRVNHVCPLCRHALPTRQPDEEEEEDGEYQQASRGGLGLEAARSG